MPKLSIAGKVVSEAIAAAPNATSRGLARYLHNRYRKLFRTVESARNLIRTQRGQNGKAKRQQPIAKLHPRPAGSVTDGFIPLPPPLPKRDAWQPVPLTFGQALLFSDVHVPFHEPEVVNVTLAHGKRLGVDCVIINGDLCDFYAYSDFVKDPRLRDGVEEIKMCRQFLGHVRSMFPKARIVFKEGNHEERLWRYVARNAPDFSGLNELSLNGLLQLEKLGIECVQNKKPLLCGEHLYVLHGHEFRSPFTNPVNPARGLYLRAKCNAIAGHLHQMSAHTEPGLDRIVSTWSTGALCDLHPDYAPMNTWCHGFAVINLKGKAWSVQNHKIIQGEVV